MTRDQILAQIATDPEYFKGCKRISDYSDLAQDLYQEMWEVLCEMPDDKLFRLHGDGNLRYFIFGILTTMWRCESSPFFQSHRRFEREVNSQVNPENLVDRIADKSDPFEEKVSELMAYLDAQENSEDRRQWYQAAVFKNYLLLGSTRNVQAKMKIPYRSVARTVRRQMDLLVAEKIILTPNGTKKKK